MGAVLNSNAGTVPVTTGGGDAWGAGAGAGAGADSATIIDPFSSDIGTPLIATNPNDPNAGPSQNKSKTSDGSGGGAIGAATAPTTAPANPSKPTSGVATAPDKIYESNPTGLVATPDPGYSSGLVAHADTGAGGLTLAEWQANVAARSPGASDAAILATAQRDFAGVGVPSDSVSRSIDNPTTTALPAPPASAPVTKPKATLPTGVNTNPTKL